MGRSKVAPKIWTDRREQYPSAPSDPGLRVAWQSRRVEAFVAGRVRFSVSGTEGKAEKAK